MLLASPILVQCGTSNDVKDLLQHLFVNESYNKRVRPTLNQSKSTEVEIEFNLVSLVDIDEVKGKMATTVFLYITWKDDYLTWSPASYGGIEEINIPQTDIWKPDIAVTNGYLKMMGLGNDFILTTVNNDGHVVWIPYEVFETKCSIDVSSFPFDEQTCNITLSEWSSDSIELGFKVGRNAINLESYQDHSEWELLSNAADSRISFASGSVVSYSFTIKRKPDYYMYNIVAPVMLLSFLAVFTFALPVECGEKIGFCMTVYLAFAVFLTIVGSFLPVTSTQSQLSKYLFSLLVMGTVIVMITTIQLRIGYRNTSVYPIPALLKGIVYISWKIHCRRRFMVSNRGQISDGKHDKENADVSDKQRNNSNNVISNGNENDQANMQQDFDSEDINWQDVTSAIDFYCFWFFLATNFVAACVIFL
ncbi:neuronal acetylcholine receptor subunit alpha-3-like [Argopecten irradians]|uniref:neuronal acetylcholine receptor subunit alpha-3-like n=1 Tax=Argopecten irradians TaxID=31199 RepID=UPI003723693C